MSGVVYSGLDRGDTGKEDRASYHLRMPSSLDPKFEHSAAISARPNLPVGVGWRLVGLWGLRGVLGV